MRLGGIVAAALAIACAGIVPARAQLCSQIDGHGRCLVCVYNFYSFSLRPGEAAQPFTCADMARDRRVVFKFGGTASADGPDGRGRVGLRVSGNGYAYRHTWTGIAGPTPVGPIALPFGATADKATVSPTLQLTACGSHLESDGACHFVLSGKICLTGLC